MAFRAPVEMVSEEKLQEAREKRKREKQTWSALKDSLFYFLFLVLLSFIVWAKKDELAYINNRMLLNQIAGDRIEIFETKVRSYRIVFG